MTDKTVIVRGEEDGHSALPAGYDLEHYRIDHVIGSGGFGITYLGEHKGLGKSFAIKEYFPEALAVRENSQIRATTSGKKDFDWGLSRFLDEARMLARFRHPSIVDVHHIFEAQGTAYLVMEYVDGQTLSNWAKELGRSPTQDELDDILRPLLSALHEVHSAGYMHRDIAPDNIYIRNNGQPVLLDFGSARAAVNAKTRSVSAIIKAGYSPIEQYTTDAEAQGPWTDIYALAATLYHVVTGDPPQESTSRQLGDRLVPAVEAGKDAFRSSFLDAIDWALSLKPTDRPQSVEAWQDALLKAGSKVAATEPVIKQHDIREPTVATQLVSQPDARSPPSSSSASPSNGEPVEERAAKNSYFSSHWLGEFHPHFALWVNCIVPAFIGLLISASVAMTITPTVQSASVGDVFVMTLLMVPQFFLWRWQIVGLFRSFKLSRARGVGMFSRRSAVVFSLIYFGLIGLTVLFYAAIIINALFR